jgi:hypothetical protein
MSSMLSRIIATDPVTLILYVCLLLIAVCFVALNLRVGPPVDGRSQSTMEAARGASFPRIGALKWSLAVIWLVIFFFVLRRTGLV